VDEKRRKSDIEIELLTQQVKQFDERVTRAIERLSKTVERHDKEIYGDGSYEGIRSDLSVLKDSEKKRNTRERVMFGGVFALIIKAFWDLFSAKHGG